MKKHRLLPLFLCAALAAMLLAGCGSAPAAEDTEAAEAAETTETATDSTGYVSDPDRCQLSEEAIAALDQVYALVKDGTIVPPANFNEMTPDNFMGLDAE